MSYAALVILAIVLLILLRSIRIASEWQRAVVLRLERFLGVKGRGLYLLFPLIDTVAQVIDLRIMTTTITAEQALTREQPGRRGGTDPGPGAAATVRRVTRKRLI
jgi:regulator of protease activity HflC (stomatin/prohibitin superfamily)